MLVEVKLCLNRDFITLKKQLSPICLLAQNTMNTKSEDVVKNVESNNVESTSNEQRQTVKPIVISRRRLLRAGAASIPLVLTMAGLAPGESIQTQASAASGLMYGGHLVHDRFAGDNTIVRDGLVWTDHNGFVLLSGGGVKTSTLAINPVSSTSSGETPITITGTSEPVQSNPPQKTFTVSLTLPTSLSANAYLHKTGNWYTDRSVSAGTTSEDLLEYIKNLPLVIKDDGNNTVGSYTATGGSSAGSNTTNLSITPDNPEFTNASGWYSTAYTGYYLEEERHNDSRPYYLLPSTSTDQINKVEYKATIKFTYKEIIDTVEYQFSCDQVVTIPLLLDVANIPAPVNPGGV